MSSVNSFLNLVQHRFASHCCEALFLQSAPIVTRELLAGPATKTSSLAHESEEVFVSMENLFLYAINEFSGNLGFLLTDRFASHTLRVLLLVLSGQSLDDPTQTTLVKSRKKETIDVADLDRKPDEASHASLRVVPESFTTSLDSLIKESIGDLDSSYLRALATHPIGNPALQSLLRLDLTHFGKTRAKDTTSIIQKLIPPEALSEGSEGATFINGLMYDPIGSRLLETIVEFCPGKIFKALYRQFFRERIGSLARNEISAYVIIKLLGRLSADDLRDALARILPQFPSLIERGRTAVIRTLAERCVARGVEAKPLAAALTDSCTEDGGKSFSLLILLRIPTHPANTTDATTPPSSEPPNSPPIPTPTASTTTPSTNSSHAPTNPSITLHASLLAQSLVLLPSQPLHTLIFDSLTYLEPPLYHTLATHTSTSHLLQTALTSPHATLIFRRKLISRFYGRIADLATHPAGSHLVDAIWTATVGLGFMRERIAEELAENEAALRESSVGRKVWRNWRMDVYKRRPNEWMREMRREAGNDGFLPFPLDGDCERKEAGREPRTRSRGGANGGTPPGAAGGKTGLQLARERFAKSHNLRKEAKTVEG